ncbi:MAG: NAD(P)H-hydrate epimerase [Planctomycetes bacterium]|nr:NAD(P)H-hydrate epimerase [Planctomycetota bacterium]
MAPIRLTRAQARAIDRAAIADYELPGIVLMEHAGRSAAEFIVRIAGTARRSVLVFCGGGNNGGDGFVIARFLHDAGFAVEALCCAPESATRGDAAIARTVAAQSGVPLCDVSTASALDAACARLRPQAGACLVIDALLGTGFEGALRPETARAIAWMNALRGLTVAIDLPSGLDCDTGVCAEPTVRAAFTATFVAEKQGFDAPSARAVLGVVEVLTIGAPRRAIEGVVGKGA